MSAVAETTFQAGIESTPGTPVAASRIIYCKAEMPMEEDSIVPIKQSRQNYMANYDAVRTHTIANWKSEEEFNFEEFAFWAQFFAKGGVTPTGSGPYEWVFNGAGTSDDLDTMTLEASDDVMDVEAPYGLCTKWEITGADGNGPKPIIMKLEWLFQQVSDTTPTGALSDRDLTGHYGVFANAQLYLDDAAGNIGGTAIDTLLLFSLKCDNKVTVTHPGGQAGLYISHNREKRYVEINLELLLDATAYSEFTDHYKDGDARFGRIRIDGAGNDQLDFDFHVAQWHKFEPKASGAVRRVSLLAQTYYDPTLGFDWQFTLVNDLSAL